MVYQNVLFFSVSVGFSDQRYPAWMKYILSLIPAIWFVSVVWFDSVNSVYWLKCSHSIDLPEAAAGDKFEKQKTKQFNSANPVEMSELISWRTFPLNEGFRKVDAINSEAEKLTMMSEHQQLALPTFGGGCSPASWHPHVHIKPFKGASFNLKLFVSGAHWLNGLIKDQWAPT